MSPEEAIAVVRRNTEEVQGKGNYEVFEELFAKNFVDHTPQPGGFSADRDGARNLYKVLRTAFPDFHAEIHWQISDGDRVTTFKTYHGTHLGEFWGIAPTGKRIQFETVDVMRVRNGKTYITDGPFAETKEALAGFYLLDARDLNDAIQMASKIPPAREGSIEVRPVRELVVGS